MKKLHWKLHWKLNCCQLLPNFSEPQLSLTLGKEVATARHLVRWERRTFRRKTVKKNSLYDHHIDYVDNDYENNDNNGYNQQPYWSKKSGKSWLMRFESNYKMSRNWIMRNWSPLRNFMVPLRELPEWRFFTIVNKNIFIHLLKIDTKTVLHVSWLLLTVSRSTSCLWTWRRSRRLPATLSRPSSPPSEAPWAPGLASLSAWSLRSELFYGETF